MKIATLKIEGMHCDGFAKTIKALVERQPGLQMAMVTFDECHARILYVEQSCTPCRGGARPSVGRTPKSSSLRRPIGR